MNKEELLKKNASLIGVSSSEKELALDILIEKVVEQLDSDGDAVRISELGVFQLKQETGKTELIFSPIHATGSTTSKTMFLRLPVSKSYEGSDEDIFSISVGKPIVPLKIDSDAGGETDASFVYIKKRIEERVEEILKNSEYLTNFNLWDEYLKTVPPKEETKIDDSELLETLSEPDTVPEDDEDIFKEMPIRENYEFSEESENKEDNLSQFGDMSPEDYETLKNLMEKEAEGDDEEPNVSEDEEESEEIDLENTFEAEEEVEPEETASIDEIKIDEKPDNKEEQKLSGEETEKADEKFDIDDTIFKEPEDDEKVDWSWGDELNEVADDEPSPEEEQSAEKKITEEQGAKEEEVDPFGTLEQTLESDQEFKMLTGEYDYQPEDEAPVDEEIRVTNLDRPRPVPPKPTRLTRLTQEDMAEEQTSAKTKEETSGYRSYRESSSRSNIFVIGGIIVILIAIIYFAFSIGSDGDAGKEVITPANTETESNGDQPIVSDKPSSTNSQTEGVGQTDVSQPRTDRGSSDVEEVRVSNLIFRRGNEFNVQVSSWRSSLKASDEVKRLRAKGYDAFSVQAYLPSKGGTWHRVRIGGFKSIDEARNFLNTSQF